MMKRVVAICWLSILVVYTSAQRPFEGGLLVGPVVSQVSGDGLGGWDKFGFTGGGWVRMGFSERWGASLAIQFVQKGSRSKQDTLTFQSFAYRLNYIDVPVVASYYHKDWIFNLGLYAGVLVRQTEMRNGTNNDVSPPFRSTDIGACGGFGYRFSEGFSVELRATTSIIPTRPAPAVVNPLSYYEQGNYNQVLMLSAMFGL